MISGYFLVNQKKIQIAKIIDLYSILVFYNLAFFLLGCLIGTYSFSTKELLYAFIPFFDGRKWFIETYMILLLLTPFLNILIYNLTESAHRVLIVIQMTLFSIWPSLLPSAPITDGGYGILNFITLYIIAAYIRLHISKKKSWLSKSILFFIFILSCGVTFLSSIFPFLQGQAWDYCYLPNIVAAAAIFCVFIQLEETKYNWINKISSTTLGVYLIHAIIYIQPLVYHKMMRVELFRNSYLQLLHFLICVVMQFIACSAIDYLRQKLWKHTMGRYINQSRLAKKGIQV